MRAYEQGLDRVVGYALPLRPWHAGGRIRWRGGSWFLRRERMYLLPGDSPMGYRLPLDSLPWAEPGDIDPPRTRDPMTRVPPLPPPGRIHLHRTAADQLVVEQGGEDLPSEEAASPANPEETSELHQSARGVVRTALCVEPRGGLLHVFMPPAGFLEEYLVLLSAVEETAAALRQPIVIEGYPPPRDPRLEHFKVTPDPGVIEVNTPPTRRWSELCTMTEMVYDEAQASRLSAEEFMLDGRHSGTGGGNHVVLGGPTPADSPWLRRPDLLASFVTYFNNHPSLTYLFSGLFLSPTSQAPRADEARHDRAASDPTEPWLVDRLFRHLLVDTTGNTHRAEFCVDKLFP